MTTKKKPTALDEELARELAREWVKQGRYPGRDTDQLKDQRLDIKINRGLKRELRRYTSEEIIAEVRRKYKDWIDTAHTSRESLELLAWDRDHFLRVLGAIFTSLENKEPWYT